MKQFIVFMGLWYFLSLAKFWTLVKAKPYALMKLKLLPKLIPYVKIRQLKLAENGGRDVLL